MKRYLLIFIKKKQNLILFYFNSFIIFKGYCIAFEIKSIVMAAFNIPGFRYVSYFYFSDRFKNQLYTDKFRKEVALFEPESCIRDFFNSDNAKELIDKMLYADSMTRMPDHPNMILDRMTIGKIKEHCRKAIISPVGAALRLSQS